MRTNALLLALGFGLAAAVGPGQAADTTPPSMDFLGSLNGDGIGISFSEPVDPATATNPAAYAVFSSTAPENLVSAIPVTNVILRPDQKSARLELAQMLKYGYLSYFQVWVTNVFDLAGNVITNPYVAGLPPGVGYQGSQVRYLYSAGIPRPGVNPAEVPSVFECTLYTEVIAGGTGLETNTDGFHYLFERISGNFDVKVKVARLDPVNRWSKAGLMVRESLAPWSRCVNVMVTPPDVPARDGSGNGANRYVASYRAASTGPMAEWPGGSSHEGVTYPNVWIGLTRFDQTFTSRWSTNGSHWSVLSRITPANPYPSSVFLGLATTSANNGTSMTTVAQYQAYGPSSTTTPLPPRLDIAATRSNVVASWFSLPGFDLEWTPSLRPASFWARVTNAVEQSEGINTIVLDPSRASQGFFRLRRW